MMNDPLSAFDWKRIQTVSECEFDAQVRDEIEENVRWYLARCGDYEEDISSQHFVAAHKALDAVTSTEFSRFQLEPIENELATVQWFLSIMAQAPPEKTVRVKRLLYFRIWKCIGKTGLNLTQGKGIPNHRISHAQKVFREICRQVGIEFTSDQALAEALKRALKDMSATGAK